MRVEWNTSRRVLLVRQAFTGITFVVRNIVFFSVVKFIARRNKPIFIFMYTGIQRLGFVFHIVDASIEYCADIEIWISSTAPPMIF